MELTPARALSSEAREAETSASVAPTSSNGWAMCPVTASASDAVPANSASSRSRSTTDPTTSAAITGGSSLTTGSWDTSYSRSRATAAPTLSSG